MFAFSEQQASQLTVTYIRVMYIFCLKTVQSVLQIEEMLTDKRDTCISIITHLKVGSPADYCSCCERPC